MLTPKDLECTDVAGGYKYVNTLVDNRPGRTEPRPFRGRDQRGEDGIWLGKRRATAIEAAQDYCDYVNGTNIVKPLPKTPTLKVTLNLQRANHPRRATATEGPRVSARRVTPNGRAARAVTPGFVYLIGITGHAEYVKVGWSSRSGFPRLNELQTGNPLLLVGLAEFPGALQDEYNLHAAHEANNVLNEWFLATPDLLSEFDLTWFQHCLLVNDTGGIDGGSP